MRSRICYLEFFVSFFTFLKVFCGSLVRMSLVSFLNTAQQTLLISNILNLAAMTSHRTNNLAARLAIKPVL